MSLSFIGGTSTSGRILASLLALATVSSASFAPSPGGRRYRAPMSSTPGYARGRRVCVAKDDTPYGGYPPPMDPQRAMEIQAWNKAVDATKADKRARIHRRRMERRAAA